MGHTVEALKDLQVPSELLQIKLYLVFCKPTLREIKHNEKQVDGCSIFLCSTHLCTKNNPVVNASAWE